MIVNILSSIIISVIPFVIGLITSKAQQGTGNSQYGTMWITDGVNNKKIKNSDPIPENWNKGRTGNK